jgi:uncharacterized membrane protein
MKKVIGFFFQGLIYTAPLAITIYIIYTFIKFFDQISPYDIPGLGLLMVVVFITFLGFVGQTIIGKPIRFLIESFISRTPIIEVVYSSIKDMMTAFFGKDKKFKTPVLVRINKISNMEKIGFITNEDLSELEITDKVAVFFPYSYNFSGELLLVPKEDIKTLNITASEAMKFIISGGITKV